MRKFFFRLETLLKVRKANEGRMQRELAYAQRKLIELAEQEDTVDKQITALLAEIRLKRQKNEHGLHETYTQLLEHLGTNLLQVQEGKEQQEAVVEERLMQLKECATARKVIEKIKEKHYSEWRTTVEKHEHAE